MNNQNHTKIAAYFLTGLSILIGGLLQNVKVAEAAATCSPTHYNCVVGTVKINPETATAFNWTCTGTVATDTKACTEAKAAVAAPTITLTADKTTIVAGEYAKIGWTSTNATTCTIKKNGVIWMNSYGPTNPGASSFGDVDSVFVGTCTGPGGVSKESSVTVKVTPAIIPVLVSLAPAKSLLEYNGETTLSWEVKDAQKCMLKKAAVVFKSDVPTKATGISTGPITGYTQFELVCSNGTKTMSALTGVSAKLGAGITSDVATVPYGGTATVSYWAKSHMQFSCTVTDGTWISPTENGKVVFNNIGTPPSVDNKKTFTNITADKTVTMTCPKIDTFNPKNIDKDPTVRTVTIKVTGAKPAAVNGVCGTAVNTCLASTKFVDKTDTATAQLWSCEGLNGGTTASCTLPIAPKPAAVNGVCGTAVNTCLASTKFVDKTDTATAQLWSCEGLNGGTAASCTLPIAPKPAIPPVVLTISANPAKVANGSATKIMWTVSDNGSECLITKTDAVAKDVAFLRPAFSVTAGVSTGALKSDTTFKITCKGKLDKKEYSASTVIVASAAPVVPPVAKLPSISIAPEVTSVEMRGNTKVKWSATDATSCSIKKDGVAWQTGTSNSGVWVGTMLKDVKISATCTGAGGTSKEVAFTIKVNAEPIVPKVVTFAPAKSLLEYNGETTLSWEIKDAQKCSLKKAAVVFKSDVPAKATGISTGPITGYTQFELVCSNGTKTMSALTGVSAKLGAGITSDKLTVPYGGTATVSYWAKSHMQFSCTVTDGTWISPTENGKVVFNNIGTPPFVDNKKTFTNITADKTVTMTCPKIDTFNPKNIDKDPTVRTVTIKVTGTKPAAVNGACGTTVNTCLNATKFVDKTDTATAQLWSCEGMNGGTTASCTLNKTTPAAKNPTIKITADKTTVPYRESVVVKWASTDAASCSIKKDGIVWQTGLNSTGVTIPAVVNSMSINATCVGLNGVSVDASLGIYAASRTIVNGACNIKLNSCLDGTTFVDKADGTSEYLWTCKGLNNGTNAECSLPITKPNEPILKLTSDFVVMDYLANPTIKWMSDKATSCSIKKDGVVWQTGLKNDGVHTGALTKDTKISGTCTGAGITSKEIVLLLKVNQTAIDGACGAVKDTCNANTIFADREDTTTNYRWYCKGINGGLTDSCMLSKQLATVVPTITITPTANPFKSTGNLSVKWTSSNARSCSTDIEGKIDSRGLKSGEILFGQRSKDVLIKVTCLGYGTQKVESLLLKVDTTPILSIFCGTIVNECEGGWLATDKPDSSTQYLWSCKEYGTYAPPAVNCFIPKTAGLLPSVVINSSHKTVAAVKSYNSVLSSTYDLSWSSFNARSCDIKKNGVMYLANANANSSGRTIESDGKDATYTIVCRGTKGELSKESSVSIKVVTEGLPAKYVSFKADNNQMMYGEPATLSWEFQNATSCKLQGDPNGIKEGLPAKMSGYKTGPMTRYADLTLVCISSTGGAAANASVTVSPKTVVSIASDKATVVAGQSAKVTYSLRAGAGSPYLCKVTDGTWVSEEENGKIMSSYIDGVKTFTNIISDKTVTMSCSYHDTFNGKIDPKNTITKSVTIKVAPR